MSNTPNILSKRLGRLTLMGLLVVVIDVSFGTHALRNMVIPNAHALADVPGTCIVCPKPYDAQVLSRHGYVIARGLELSNGKPIWVEIDQNGDTVNEIGVATGPLANAVTLDAASYRSFGVLLANTRAQNPALTQGAYILSREQYLAQDFGSIAVPRSNPAPTESATESISIPKPPLLSTTQSVLIRANSTIIDPRLLPAEGPILLQVPVDLRAGVYQLLDSSIKSLLLDDAGQVLVSSEYNIGFKNGFYRSDDPNEEGDPLGPIKGAKVDAGVYTHRQIGGVTDDSGFYGFNILKNACPGFQYNIGFDIQATFAMRSFHPEAPLFTDITWAATPDFLSCSGISALLNPFGFEGMIKGSIESIELGATSSNITRSGAFPIYVDAMVFAGIGKLSNDGETRIPQNDTSITEYGYAAPAFTPIQTPHLDLNADRQDDFVILQGTALNTTQSIYFNGAGTNAQGQVVDADGNVIDGPDLQRLADIEADFEDQGLLASLSKDDLKKTDIYLYRVSNGQQIAKHSEMSDAWLQENDDHFAYRFPIPGSRFGDLGLSTGIRVQNRSQMREAWQDGQNLAEALRPFKSDHLRPGEQVKIVAINRPTGYIGTVMTTVAVPQNGLLDIPADKIILRPPNLKIWAERIYTPTAGLSRNEPKRYTIGFEGSALTSDTQVLIHTQWFEHDGTALPEDLEGYTARMAVVTGLNSLAGGDVATFPIRPGSHLQMVRFQGDILGSEHFYIHVSGYPQWQDLGPGAANEGPLQYRPKHYVPVKVPIFDEVATRQLRNLNTYNQQDGNQGIEKVPAVYQWPYRPEMQFSVFELAVRGLELRDINNQTLLVDLMGDTQLDVFSELLSDNTVSANLLYDLLDADFSPLPTFGPERQLIFSLGAEEVQATYTLGGSVQFDDMAHLSQLDSEDYFSIRLYSNNDAENILWEWEFGKITMAVDFNRDGKVKFYSEQSFSNSARGC